MAANANHQAAAETVLDRLAEELESALVKEEPDPISLCNRISRLLRTNTVESEEILRDVVLTLNRTTFPAIRQIELLLTSKCNLRCKYFFERSMDRSEVMPLKTALAAADLFLRYSEGASDPSVTFFGGEPLLASSVLEKTAAFIRQRKSNCRGKIHLGVTTNGTLMTERHARMLERYGVFATVSLDGLAETHNAARIDAQGRGSFDQAARALSLLRSTQRILAIKVTTLPANVGRVFDDVRCLYEDYGVRKFLLGHASGIPWTCEQMSEYCDGLKRLKAWQSSLLDKELTITGDCDQRPVKPYFGCRAGRTAIAVRPNGTIGCCSRILGASSSEVMHEIGDVRYGLYRFRRRLDFVTASRVEEHCRRQGIDGEYFGGCYGLNCEESGDVFYPSTQDQEFARIQRRVLGSGDQRHARAEC